LLNRPTGSQTPTSKVTPNDVLGNAFYPYTLPITVGPGSISVAITLGAHLTASLRARSILSPSVLISALGAVILICIIIYVCYRYARPCRKCARRYRDRGLYAAVFVHPGMHRHPDHLFRGFERIWLRSGFDKSDSETVARRAAMPLVRPRSRFRKETLARTSCSMAARSSKIIDAELKHWLGSLVTRSILSLLVSESMRFTSTQLCNSCSLRLTPEGP
jgi:hypothetical protein